MIKSLKILKIDLEDQKSSDSDSVEVKIISSIEVNSAIVLLRSYLQQSKEGCRTHLTILDNIEDFIDKNKKFNQAKLESYFKITNLNKQIIFLFSFSFFINKSI